MNDRTYLWWTILPVVPFLCAIALVHMLSDGSITLVSSQMAPEAAAEAVPGVSPQAEPPGSSGGTDALLYADHRDLRFTGGLLIYGAVALLHSILCVGVIGYAILYLSRLPPQALRRSVLVLLALVAVVTVASFAARDVVIGALNLTYRTNCAALVAAEVGSHLTPTACDRGPLSPLAKLALGPYILGIAAAAMTSALTATAYDGARGEADLLAGAERVDRAFQATALVLATSVATLVAFYRLPLRVISDENLRDLVRDFGDGMTMIWGVGFTLTLLAVYAPATLLVQRLLAEYRDSTELSDLRARLADQGPRKRLQDALTLLAPLLVGSAGTLLDFVARAAE